MLDSICRSSKFNLAIENLNEKIVVGMKFSEVEYKSIEEKQEADNLNITGLSFGLNMMKIFFLIC